MTSITVGGLTFRWAENTLLITTPIGQHLLNGRATADLLVFLDANRDEIFTVEQTSKAPEQAQPPAPSQFVIGSESHKQGQQLPVGNRNQRHRRQSRGTSFRGK